MDKTFTITVTMKDRWVHPFMSMLRRMERDGNIGHSEFVGLYSDGDGDFRPHFSTDEEYKKFQPLPDYLLDGAALYDADYDEKYYEVDE